MREFSCLYIRLLSIAGIRLLCVSLEMGMDRIPANDCGMPRVTKTELSRIRTEAFAEKGS